jgi:hypothetical protein
MRNFFDRMNVRQCIIMQKPDNKSPHSPPLTKGGKGGFVIWNLRRHPPLDGGQAKSGIWGFILYREDASIEGIWGGGLTTMIWLTTF